MKNKVNQIENLENDLENDNEKLLDILVKGNHFGEIALMSNFKRTCSAISQNTSVMLTLNKNMFGSMKE